MLLCFEIGQDVIVDMNSVLYQQSFPFCDKFLSTNISFSEGWHVRMYRWYFSLTHLFASFDRQPFEEIEQSPVLKEVRCILCHIWLSWFKSCIEKILPVCRHLSWNIQNLFSPIQQCSFQISSGKGSLISAKLSHHFFKFYVRILRCYMSAAMTPLIMDDRAYHRAKSRAASLDFNDTFRTK